MFWGHASRALLREVDAPKNYWRVPVVSVPLAYAVVRLPVVRLRSGALGRCHRDIRGEGENI